jgi:hypothetical protein
MAAAATLLTGGAGVSGLGWKGLLAALPLQAGGAVAKAAANAVARRNTRLAEELMRYNSPLAESLRAQQTLSPSASFGRDAAVMRSIMPGLLEEPPVYERKAPPGYI